MATYTTGTANTPAIFLTAIQNAAIAAGWVLSHRGLDTGGGDPANTDYRRDVLWLAAPSGYNFGIAPKGSPSDPESSFRILGATGFDSGQEYYNQPNDWYLEHYFNYIPCLAYHIFTSTDYLYCVVEAETRHFRHFGFGLLEKQDNYPGGAFLASHTYEGTTNQAPFRFNCESPPSAAVYVGGDGQLPNWRDNERSYDDYPERISGALNNTFTLTSSLVASMDNQFNRQVLLVPLYLGAERIGGYHSPIGYPPGIRACNTTYSGDAGTDVLLGPDLWKLFPIGKKGSSSTRTEAYNVGLAYLAN